MHRTSQSIYVFFHQQTKKKKKEKKKAVSQKEEINVQLENLSNYSPSESHSATNADPIHQSTTLARRIILQARNPYPTVF